ncbi:MAG TPA: hypothetical protein VL854_10460 [Nitrososphaeraceae archaeon]|nr:hypothetical protein [Nitrososphaeraceae archaeon]
MKCQRKQKDGHVKVKQSDMQSNEEQSSLIRTGVYLRYGYQYTNKSVSLEALTILLLKREESDKPNGVKNICINQNGSVSNPVGISFPTPICCANYVTEITDLSSRSLIE